MTVQLQAPATEQTRALYPSFTLPVTHGPQIHAGAPG